MTGNRNTTVVTGLNGLCLSEIAVQPARLTGWRLPAVGFVMYGTVGTAAHIFHAQSFLILGAALMFLCVWAASISTLVSARMDASVGIVFSILLLSVAATVYYPSQTVAHSFVKHAVVCLLYVLVFGMNLPPIYSTPSGRIFLLTILSMGAISLLIPNATEIDGVTRVSGFFVNPNNMSLTMMALLFLIDEDKDKRSIKAAIHGIVVLFLLLSGTSGAILAYTGAMLYKGAGYLTSVRKPGSKLIAILLATLVVFLACLIPAAADLDIPVIRKIVDELSLIREELPVALSGYEYDYAELSIMHERTSFSGIWRITHWRKAFDLVASADVFQLLLGHGIGSSSLLLEKLPHNDYLRVLIEQGLVGLGLATVFFLLILRRIGRRYHYCVVAVALYSITENNMDNLLFMGIFTFFLASAQNPHPSKLYNISTIKG